MMNAVRSALNSRFLSPSNARFAAASWAFSMSTAARSRSACARRQDQRLGRAQQAPQRVGGGGHGGEQQRAQAARRRRLEREFPPQLLAVGHVPIREQHQPHRGAEHQQHRHDPREREALLDRARRAGENARAPRPAPPRPHRG